ncbi:MAG TPA: efflux RND transporter permease subunit [Sphingobium sp.]|nr:efflux RND transporter permease subunit [Sphingobium sp.]
MRNISAWSIRNPVPPLVIFIALMLAGIVAFNKMAIVDNPDIDFPAAQISITQPGAAPTEIETQITQRVEAAVRAINGVDEITSTAREGGSDTFVQFQIGIDPNVAVQEVKNAVDQIRSDLPDGILEPFVQKVDVSGSEIAFFAVQATDMTIEQLSWYVDDTVAKRLLGIPGMARVSRGGGVDREIRVILDPARMQSLGVTASQVNQTLRQVNINAAGGQAEIAGSRQSVRVLGNARDAYDLGQTQISLGNGHSVLLSEIATVRDGYGEQTRLSKANGKQVVTFSLERAKGASDVSVYDEAIKTLDKLHQENPDIQFRQLFTSVNYTKAQYSSSMHAIVEGAVLAVIVVFIFLRDWRATAISALAIPLAAIPTFFFMDLMGFNLNSLSLLALGLVAGVLVDDAIVEIENIVRHMRMGKTAYQASIDAADEIGLAVVATTFSIVAVFLPVGLMPGISGQFFKNFGFTVVISVLISLAVARMITPLVAAYFLEHHGEQKHGEGWLMDRYMGLLRWSLGHRLWMMLIGLAAFGLTVLLLVTMPQQFQPNQDNDFSRINIEMVPGTTLRQTEAVADSVGALIASQPDVDMAMETVQEGNARIFITLKPDRKRSSIEFERALAPRLATFPDARVSFASQQGGAGTGRDISVMLSGSDPVVLEQTAAKLAEEMKTLPDVVAPRVNADMQRPELIIRPRLELAAQLGVTTSALSQTIRIATLGDINQNSAKFSLSDRQVPIRVMLPESSRRDISTIENLPVQTSAGGSVPLSRVAEISFGAGPTTIQRYAQQRRIFVGADLAKGAIKGPVMKDIQKLPTMKNLPTGVTNAAVGSDRWQQELIVNFIIAVGSGVLLVFAVLVLLYKRFISPLVNMCSLALAPLGGLLFLLLLGQPISLPVYIGLLMLLGIVAKNSILLIDFALEEMDRGVPKFEAIMDAGHKRAQPIVMTTVAMTAGMVPTALSLSGDSAWRSPMGVTVIGGLVLSTLLTLAIVPAAFSLADGMEKRLGPWLRRKVLTYDGKGEESATLPAE